MIAQVGTISANNDQTIGGMTPIEPMLDVLSYPSLLGSSAEALSRKSSVRLTAELEQAAAEAAGVSRAEFPSVAKQLLLPVAVSGLNGRGMDRLAAMVKRYRASERCTLLLFAGDLISPSVESSVFKGAQLIDGLNLLRVDAAALGNHEFDYGPAELQKRIGESRFPWLATNVFTSGARPFPGTHQYLIRNVCGTTVGIFGLVTAETATASSPGTTWFGDPIAVARAIVPVIRRSSAQRIIALTHLHMHEDEQMLRAVPEIDLVIGGHEHDPLTSTIGGRLIAKAGSDAKWLGVTRVPLSGAPRAATS